MINMLYSGAHVIIFGGEEDLSLVLESSVGGAMQNSIVITSKLTSRIADPTVKGILTSNKIRPFRIVFSSCNGSKHSITYYVTT